LSGKIAQSGAEEIYKKIRAGRREVYLFQHHLFPVF
jgi:alpha-mannosidase II